MCESVHLQNEHEIVNRFGPLVEEVQRRSFVVIVELEFVDDIRVSEDPQQDFLCDLEWAEQVHL